MMKEPEINVGIVNAQEIHFSLNGNFFAKGETVCGEQQVAFSEGGILWNDPEIDIKWPLDGIDEEDLIFSEKDYNWKLMKDTKTNF